MNTQRCSLLPPPPVFLYWSSQVISYVYVFKSKILTILRCFVKPSLAKLCLSYMCEKINTFVILFGFLCDYKILISIITTDRSIMLSYKIKSSLCTYQLMCLSIMYICFSYQGGYNSFLRGIFFSLNI